MNRSILFWEPRQAEREEEPFWQDLNLDQLAADLCLGRERFHLERIWRTPVGLRDRENRQAVFRELDREEVLQPVQRFVRAVSRMEQQLQGHRRLTNERQRQWQQTADVLEFDRELLALEKLLDGCSLQSEGMQTFRQSLRDHNREQNLRQTVEQGTKLLEDLARVHLRLRCFRNQVEVLPEAPREDYGDVLRKLFSGFRDAETRDYTYRKFAVTTYLNRVEEGIAEGAAYLYPEVFDRLAAFAEAHKQPISVQLRQLYEELPFYLSYLQYIEPLREAGLPFCAPSFSREKHVSILDGFDLILAHRLEGTHVVCNDFTASPSERLFTVTGANQGGKTTYARMVGQVAVLASLGVPVPGSRAELFPVDRVLTHFEREETVETENGKLMDDLERMRTLLQQATADSLLLFNETFSSTTLTDALWLARQVLDRLRERGCLCLYVTFLDSRLQSRGDLVSLQTVVGPAGERTYAVRREASDGRAYALAMAGRHHLLYDQIRERMQP